MASRRLPALYGSRDYVEAVDWISYGTDYHELFRRAAEYVDRVLKGQRPDQLPAQQAERFEMVINMKAAQALGLDIPPSLRASGRGGRVKGRPGRACSAFASSPPINRRGRSAIPLLDDLRYWRSGAYERKLVSPFLES